MFRPLSQTKFINDANLVSYWKLEDTSDSKASYTLTNNGTVTFSAGQFNNGADFGSTNSSKYLSIADNLGLSTYNAGIFSISGWINIATAPSSGEKQNLWGVNKQTELQIDFKYINASGTLKLIAGNWNGTTYTEVGVNQTLTTGIWYHIVCVKNGTTILIYVNGVNILNTSYSQTNLSPNRANQFNISADCFDNNNFFKGMKDDIGVFSRALSAGEVAELYQSMTLGEYLPNSSTKLLLHLNGSSADSSGNNNNGTDTAITYSQANGKFGQGAGFNGSSSFIKGLYNLGISFGSSYTYGGWIKLGAEISSGSYYMFVLNHSATGADTTQLRYEYNGGTRRLDFVRYNSGGVVSEAIYNTTLGTSNWYHLMIVYNSATTRMDIYVNGNSVVNTTSSNTAGSSGPYTQGYAIGSEISLNGPINGAIDEVIVENRAWSASEVKKYFSYTKARFGII